MTRSRRQRRPPQRRHLHAVPSPRPELDEDQEDLLQSLRGALRSGEPLDFLLVVSTLVEAADSRSRDPFHPDPDAQAEIESLVELIFTMSTAETTAALTVMRAFVDDPALVAAIDDELATRRQPLPRWLAHLQDAYATDDSWRLFHVLGDETSYLFDVDFVGGRCASALVEVEHNLGSVVVDVLFSPYPAAHMVALINAELDEDTTLAPTEPDNVRAVVEDAVQHGRLLYPQPTGEMWPLGRPLLTWMAGLLPLGGEVPQRDSWTKREKRELTSGFFASSFGQPLDDRDHRALLKSVIWFGTDYGPGDPMRWSPVSVEILMEDWFPRKIVADAAYLSKLPELLRAFIRYCHRGPRIRPELTQLTIDKVDELEPEYLRVIRSARPQGPEALLAHVMGELPAPDDVVEMILRGAMEDAVGGAEALAILDAEPLPDEPFDWRGVADDIRPVVGQILEVCDRCADELFDVEHRTAMRRFLHRVAIVDPQIFRRKASPVRGAAAVAWVIARANESVDIYYGPVMVKDLLAWFDVKGSVSSRAEPMLRALGIAHTPGAVLLGTPDLLTSQRRSSIIERRDQRY